MSLFDWLLIGHLVGDFILQNDTMAKNKPHQWQWLLRHIGLYMVGMTIIIGAYSWSHSLPLWLAVAALFFVFGTHVILDRRSFTTGWMRLVGISPERSWLTIVIDQIFHLITLGLVAQALAAASG